MSNLILHCGAERISREDLKSVPTPAPTSTWKPVPHFEVAELINHHAVISGHEIVSEEYGLNPSGTKMFGLLKFAQNGNPERTRALGFRNSHDKSFALGFAVGCSVTVCDNLVLAGERTFHRKHTSGIEIESLIPRAFDGIEEEYLNLDRSIEFLKVQSVTVDQARIIIVKAAEIRAIPSCDIITVLKEFINPAHEDFSDHNRWSLYNSFTETAKKYSPARADQCYRSLAGLFGLDNSAEAVLLP